MLQAIRTFLQDLSVNHTLWIAYSGGLDSHVLLHLLKQANLSHTLRAVHVNHSLNPKAVQWAQHCQRVCDDLAIPLIQIQVDARAPAGISPEEYARQKRYEALIALLAKDDKLITAHHQDDQAETLLLQLLRGAGLPGLSSMGEMKQLSAGMLMRPLLSCSRATLHDYAAQHDLHWIEDDSNTDIKFNRNYLRHHIMPVLQARWPGANKVMARVANHCAQAQQLLTEVAAADRVLGKQPNTLSISALKKLTKLRQMNVIRYWLQTQNYLLPSEKQLHEIIKTMLHSKQDAVPIMALPHLQLRRYQDELYALPPALKSVENKITLWQKGSRLTLPGVGDLMCQSIPAAEGQKIFIAHARHGAEYSLTVRFRCGGEVFHPAKRIGSHPLKKLMQEWCIPPWDRASIPLIYINDELACVVGYAVGAAFVKKESEPGEDFYFRFVKDCIV